jgi:hypothetical protein
MLDALIAVKATPFPDTEVPVIAPAANSPDAPRRTIVEAPLLEEAEVLALSIVPDAILEALIAVKATPLPEIETAVILPAPKPPDPSRKTIVEAPLAEAAEVRALSIVPDEMLEALIALIAEPSPLKAPETVLAPKLPEASRRTIVLALFAVLPVVLALSKVPLDMFEALIAVRATPLPDTLVNAPVVPLKVVALDVVAVMVLAVKSPLESRATIVDAPLAEAAVVLSLAKVPTVMLEALMATLAALVSWP